MSKLKIGNSQNYYKNTQSAWVDRDLLSGKKILTFADVLEKTVLNGKKLKLKKPKNPPQVVKAEPIKREDLKNNINGSNDNFMNKENVSDGNNEKGSFKIAKIKRQKDREIMDNFLNNILLPMMKDAYVNLENLENNKYKQRQALIGVLDKRSLNEGDMVEGIVYDWSDSAKKYKVLVGKDGDRVAWAYISDEDQKKDIAKGDKVYFVVVKNSSGKNVLKDYYPQEGDLNSGDIVNLKYANVKIEKLLKSKKDPETGEQKAKKIGMGYITIGLGDYVGIIKKQLLPKGYKPGKDLDVKIKEITKKGNRLVVKFDEDFLKKQLNQSEKKMSQ